LVQCVFRVHCLEYSVVPGDQTGNSNTKIINVHHINRIWRKNRSKDLDVLYYITHQMEHNEQPVDNTQYVLELEAEITRLKEELAATKAHLKRYTAPAGRKEYYENNKERIKESRLKAGYKYTYPYDPEKRKEYNKLAYQKRKERLQKEAEEKQNSENI